MADNLKAAFWISFWALVPWVIGTFLESLAQLSFVMPDQWYPISRSIAGIFSLCFGGFAGIVIWYDRNH